jgi:hypothetical protein
VQKQTHFEYCGKGSCTRTTSAGTIRKRKNKPIRRTGSGARNYTKTKRIPDHPDRLVRAKIPPALSIISRSYRTARQVR